MLTPSDSGDEYFEPRMLPSGDAIVFGLQEGAGLENEHVATLSLETGEQRVLIEGASNPYYAASGHLLFVRGSTLMAAPFDVENVEVIGEPVVLPESVRRTGQLAADYALSDTGTLVYVPGGDGFSIGRTLVWVDRAGQEEPTAVPEAEYVWARVSPDGDRVASHSVERDNTDVWISELARGTRIRLTTDLAADSRPLWTQDGERIVFASDRGGSWGLYARAADGTGVVEHLVTVEDVISLRPYGWSPDGNVLLFDYRTDSRDIGLLRMNNGGAWEPLLQTDANEGQPALSPDGEWLAYASNETGQFEIYVQQFPDLGGRRQISTGGGIDPLWSSDGTELFYYSVPPTAMMVVAIGREPTFAVGNPEVVFEQRYYRRQRDGRQHSIAPDSTRFLMVKGVGATNDTDAPGQIVVVQNWHQELLERVPVD